MVLRELGPFPGTPGVHGVTHDGKHVWACIGDALLALDPLTGDVARRIEAKGSGAGTAFDGRHLYQLAGAHILVLDPASGEELRRIPAPSDGGSSGMTWAEGRLWIGQYRDRSIVEVDAKTGEVLRTVKSDRFVTGVTFRGGALWHGTWEDDVSELRRVDPATSEVLERHAMPEGKNVSGLEADAEGTFYAGGGKIGVVRAVRVR